MISVVLLNFSRPVMLRTQILPVLDGMGVVDEIIVSHGKKDAYFVYESPKIKSLDHSGEMNKKYGLTLRFVSGAEARNKYVVIMDDDLIPSEKTLISLLEKIKKDERIHGIYGRNMDMEMNYSKTNVFGEVPIALTRCLITTREMCKYFVDNFRKYENELVRNSKPYWNGEDILFSILSSQKYGKLPMTHDMKHTNTISNYLSLNDAISRQKGHDKYRKEITRHFIKLAEVENVLEDVNIKGRKSEIRYFYENSVLLPLSVVLILVACVVVFLKFYR